jgi:hypothetical protein
VRHSVGCSAQLEALRTPKICVRSANRRRFQSNEAEKLKANRHSDHWANFAVWRLQWTAIGIHRTGARCARAQSKRRRQREAGRQAFRHKGGLRSPVEIKIILTSCIPFPLSTLCAVQSNGGHVFRQHPLRSGFFTNVSVLKLERFPATEQWVPFRPKFFCAFPIVTVNVKPDALLSPSLAATPFPRCRR